MEPRSTPTDLPADEPRAGTILVRERMRHPLAVRHVTVSATRTVAPAIVRITLRGDDLDGFAAPGPADHVKVFFVDPATGGLTTPIVTDDGVRRPETGRVIARDYTPHAFRPDAAQGAELDIDVVLHGDDGPASAWAAHARPGDVLAIAGPRGSLLPPSGARAVVIVADETALPAAARWLEAFDPDVPVTALLGVADLETSGYLEERAGRTLRWFSGPDRDARIEEALRAIAPDAGTFVFLAGEATAIAPLRRYLRRELGLPKEQVDAHGYWKHGVANLDHHAPLDPADPD